MTTKCYNIIKEKEGRQAEQIAGSPAESEKIMEKKKIDSMIDSINRAIGECSNKDKSEGYKFGYCFSLLEQLKRDLETELKFIKSE